MALVIRPARPDDPADISRAGEVRSLQEWHVLAREMSPEWTG